MCVCCIASRTRRTVIWVSGKMLRTRRAVVLGTDFTSDMKMQSCCFTSSSGTPCSCTQELQRGITARKYLYLVCVGVCITNDAPPSLSGQHPPYLDTFYAVTSADANYYSSSIHLIQTRFVFFLKKPFYYIYEYSNFSNTGSVMCKS